MKSSYICPCVTALKEDGTLDLIAQGKIYDHIVEGGIDGVLVLGSIGEFFALTMEQKKELITFAVEYINKRIPVIIGTTSMVFEEIVSLSNFAIGAGADAVMIIPPYYFVMGENSVESYYDKLAQAIDGNIYLYNFPDRTGYDLTPKTTLNLLRKHSNIVGYKDTLAGVDHTRELVKAIKKEFPNFLIYSGFDDNFARNVLSGGDGCIAGLSNLYPDLCHRWVDAFAQGNVEEIAEIQQTVDRLMDIYKVGTPFVPYIKQAMAMTGLPISATSTIPMPSVSEAQKEQIKALLL